ncbi:cAMP-dependent protein kinase inhibitor beta-like [Littorina saxatilis]|uniref:cAMP-dependent protein kinase inhibitor beta-like n=1 Tax=Littorina saxatilis TaxID=31220 RepID=UPI0038B46EEF
MVKPTRTAHLPTAAPPSARESPGDPLRAPKRAPKSGRYGQHRTGHRLRTLCRKVKAAAKQPVAGTAEAGGQGSAPDKSQKDKDGSEMETKEALENFMHTGRTGRRNAMPDISDETHAGLTTAELPLDMAKLSCAEGGSKSGQSSKSPPKTSNPPS